MLHTCKTQLILEPNNTLNRTIYIEGTTELEVFNILHSLNVNKSGGIDQIRPQDLKENAHIFAPLISKLINLRILEETFPQDIKTALVKPIYKSRAKSDFNNYRPISILPIIEKVYEEILVRRLKCFIEKHKLIHKQQYGYQAGKSINKLLGDFTSYLNEAKSRRCHSLILFIDFSKAFDTLDHEKLMYRLEQMGIRGPCYELIKSYLRNRSFKIKIKEYESSPVEISSGVPQGSKIGPLLYLIYSNGLLNLLKNTKGFTYADDTALIAQHKSLTTAANILQNELDNISKWAHDNGLIINVQKTKIMHIMPHMQKSQKIRIFCRDIACEQSKIHELEVVQSIKYLGVIVDNDLRWKTQIENVRKKLRKTAYALYHLKLNSSGSVVKQACHALAESYLRYGITAWGTSCHYKQLKKIQNKLIHFLALEDQQNILTVENIFKTSIIDLYYKDKNFLIPISHLQFSRRKVSCKFKVPRFYNTFGKQTLPCIVPEIFNELPEGLLNISNIKRRKLQIRQFYTAKQTNQVPPNI